ncbi:MAG TPA: DNRLRE domain-containing protein [Vicinamibacterales bacterium]|nr:DNRLRE domain-containing protein [Vicinamibacterales bacterium]
MHGGLCFDEVGVRRTILAVALATISLLPAEAAAQKTITLSADDATLRGGSYANTNYGNGVLATRRSDDASYERRALLKFDTHNTIPAGSPISSARLVLTVAGGNADSRRIGAYCVTKSFNEWETTWRKRKGSYYWSTPGADTAHYHATESVNNTPGQKVEWDVTSQVQEVVKGVFGSRYVRVVLVDLDGAARSSYKEYYSSESSDSSVRPRLVVTYGSSSTSTTSAPTTSSSGTRLKVLEYNTHHGVGTDGKYDINRIASFIAKHNPDVAAIIEAEKYTGWGNEDQPRRYRDLLQAKTGRTWYYVFAQEYGDWSSNGKGNLLLSRYPFVMTDRHALSWDRTIATAAINVNGRNISILVTHLDPDYPSRRYTQAQQVKTYASGIAENRIITGDWNAWPDQSSVTTMAGTYRDAWVEAQKIGTATYYSSYSAGQTKKGRIDYIFYSRGASHLKIVKMQLLDSRDSSGVMPSDHRPIMATFEVR